MYSNFQRFFLSAKNSKYCFNFVTVPELRINEGCRATFVTNLSSEDDKSEESVLKDNPFYQKYSDKIAALQKTNSVKFQERLEKMKSKKKPASVKNGTNSMQNLHETDSNFKRKVQKASYTDNKGLGNIMKLEKIESLDNNQISKIWHDYHKDKNTICAVIPCQIYEKIQNLSLEFPTFLYPVVRREGYEFFVGQFFNHNCYFTQLLNYQTFKEDSPICLTMNHYTELEDRGIILMRGEYDVNVLSALEAQFLANQVKLYYGSEDSKRQSILYSFNKEPQNFKHSDVIDQLERSVL